MSKLQVLLLMEADDDETIAAAKAARPPDHVRFVVVPAGGPQTKPKACNVGLALAEGEFLVIYDAEDRPEPGQLREVVARFLETPDDVVCLQARLNYFNARENLLTRMFTLEYSFWFDDMLPGLDAMRLPIPLGGTSNHFRVSALRELGGWDPYNVTEDADLGVRAAAEGKTVGIIESTTWEEACSEWKAWIRQRTRWIKGYMVTALVHMRRPRQLSARRARAACSACSGSSRAPRRCSCAARSCGASGSSRSSAGRSPASTSRRGSRRPRSSNLIVGNGAMILLERARGPAPARVRPHPVRAPEPGVLGAALDRRVPRALAAHREPVALGEDAARHRARAAPAGDRRGHRANDGAGVGDGYEPRLTGSSSRPRRVRRPFHLGSSAASSISGKRSTSVPSAMRPSRRASAAPRQWWTPLPNDTC